MPSFRSPQRVEGRGEKQKDSPGDTASFRETSNLCQRCRRLTIQHQDLDIAEFCEVCHRDPEFVLVTRSCNVELSKLQTKLLQASPDVKVIGAVVFYTLLLRAFTFPILSDEEDHWLTNNSIRPSGNLK